MSERESNQEGKPDTEEARDDAVDQAVASPDELGALRYLAPLAVFMGASTFGALSFYRSCSDELLDQLVSEIGLTWLVVIAASALLVGALPNFIVVGLVARGRRVPLFVPTMLSSMPFSLFWLGGLAASFATSSISDDGLAQGNVMSLLSYGGFGLGLRMIAWSLFATGLGYALVTSLHRRTMLGLITSALIVGASAIAALATIGIAISGLEQTELALLALPMLAFLVSVLCVASAEPDPRGYSQGTALAALALLSFAATAQVVGWHHWRRALVFAEGSELQAGQSADPLLRAIEDALFTGSVLPFVFGVAFFALLVAALVCFRRRHAELSMMWLRAILYVGTLVTSFVFFGFSSLDIGKRIDDAMYAADPSLSAAPVSSGLPGEPPLSLAPNFLVSARERVVLSGTGAVRTQSREKLEAMRAQYERVSPTSPPWHRRSAELVIAVHRDSTAADVQSLITLLGEWEGTLQLCGLAPTDEMKTVSRRAPFAERLLKRRFLCHPVHVNSMAWDPESPGSPALPSTIENTDDGFVTQAMRTELAESARSSWAFLGLSGGEPLGTVVGFFDQLPPKTEVILEFDPWSHRYNSDTIPPVLVRAGAGSVVRSCLEQTAVQIGEQSVDPPDTVIVRSPAVTGAFAITAATGNSPIELEASFIECAQTKLEGITGFATYPLLIEIGVHGKQTSSSWDATQLPSLATAALKPFETGG